MRWSSISIENNTCKWILNAQVKELHQVTIDDNDLRRTLPLKPSKTEQGSTIDMLKRYAENAIYDVAPEGDLSALMQWPLFVLRAGDTRERRYTADDLTVTIRPGQCGSATIHDKDVWLYCITQIFVGKDHQMDVGQTARFHAYDFLLATGRDASGRAYYRLRTALNRLEATRVEMSTGQSFGLIEAWRPAEHSASDDRSVAIEVMLPEWLWKTATAEHVLPVSQEYFDLRKPLHRRVYELARRHCTESPVWRVKLETLRAKTGSGHEDELFKFRASMKSLVQSQLPDYKVVYNQQNDEMIFSQYGSQLQR